MRLQLRFRVSGVVGKGRPRFWGGHAVTPPKTRAYERQVQAMALRAISRHGEWDKTLPMNVRIVVVRSIPSRFRKADRAMARKRLLIPQAKPDIDNVCKSILDGMNGTIYEDDSQVYELSARQVYGRGQSGRVLVFVSAGV